MNGIVHALFSEEASVEILNNELVGNFGDFPLRKILIRVWEEKKTGTLTIRREKRRKDFFFQNGHILIPMDKNPKTEETALASILKWKAGTFSFKKELPAETEENAIFFPVPNLLEQAKKFSKISLNNKAPEEESPESLEIIREIERKVKKGDFQIPPLPDSMLQMETHIHNERSSAHDLVKIMAADQILTSSILKMVNSAFYSLSAPISSLQHALVYMGLNTIQGIVSARAVSSLNSRNRSTVRRILRHSFLCAYLCRKIAPAIGADEEEAFVCGLLHNIGKTLLMDLCLDYDLSFQQRARLAEKHHQKVGVLLAAQWKLPEVVTETIKHHTNPVQALPAPPYAQIVFTANQLLSDTPQNMEPVWDKCPDLLPETIDPESILKDLKDVEELARSLFY